MFQVHGLHSGHNEEVSLSQHDRIAQNQKNLLEKGMNHCSSNCQFVCTSKFILIHQW